VNIPITSPIEELWRDFARNVIPDDAPEEQYREMRRAFMSGAQTATLKMEALLEEPGELFVTAKKLVDHKTELAKVIRRIGQGKD
jgi:hypothetical protein